MDGRKKEHTKLSLEKQETESGIFVESIWIHILPFRSGSIVGRIRIMLVESVSCWSDTDPILAQVWIRIRYFPKVWIRIRYLPKVWMRILDFPKI